MKYNHVTFFTSLWEALTYMRIHLLRNWGDIFVTLNEIVSNFYYYYYYYHHHHYCLFNYIGTRDEEKENTTEQFQWFCYSSLMKVIKNVLW